MAYQGHKKDRTTALLIGGACGGVRSSRIGGGNVPS